EAKAGLLGVPSRRTFFTVGGAAVVGSAVMVGCSTAKKKQLTQTGTTETTAAATTTTAPGSAETDAILLRTAQSIEALAVSTYDKALASGLVTTPSVSQAFTLFRDQHQQHADQIASITRGVGATPYTEPNTFLDITVVTPGLAAAADEDAVLALATVLEKTAAETYTYAGGTLTTTELRSAIMTIGPTEARHLSLLYILQDLDPTPVPFMATADRTPDDSFIGDNGPVKVPDAPTTTTTAAS
ncbi:MAG: ferritin-like domain-containing protein, partial [Acidimicrobiales bacterium]